MLDELRYRVLLRVNKRYNETAADDAYTRHELEDRVLCLVEQGCNLVEALQHSSVVANSTGHPSRKLCTKAVIDVELVWRSRCQEGVVETVGSSKGLADSFDLVVPLLTNGGAILPVEFLNLKIERQVLLTHSFLKELAVEQAPRWVANDNVRPVAV